MYRAEQVVKPLVFVTPEVVAPDGGTVVGADGGPGPDQGPDRIEEDGFHGERLRPCPAGKNGDGRLSVL